MSTRDIIGVFLITQIHPSTLPSTAELLPLLTALAAFHCESFKAPLILSVGLRFTHWPECGRQGFIRNRTGYGCTSLQETFILTDERSINDPVTYHGKRKQEEDVMMMVAKT